MITQEKIKELAKQAGFERLGVYAQFGDDWVGLLKTLRLLPNWYQKKQLKNQTILFLKVASINHIGKD